MFAPAIRSTGLTMKPPSPICQSQPNLICWTANMKHKLVYLPLVTIQFPLETSFLLIQSLHVFFAQKPHCVTQLPANTKLIFKDSSSTSSVHLPSLWPLIGFLNFLFLACSPRVFRCIVQIQGCPICHCPNSYTPSDERCPE